jgi:hypothetical protein
MVAWSSGASLPRALAGSFMGCVVASKQTRDTSGPAIEATDV